MCPWHAACFNVKSGDIEDAPAINAIPSYPVRITDGEVYVSVPQTKATSRTMSMCPASAAAANNKRVVVVGGGAAGLVAVETLRQEGFSGDILLLSSDSNLPYDRTKLSKNPSSALQPEKLLLRSQSFFDQNKIEVRLNTTVTAVDTTAKSVSLSSGDKVPYDELILATGAHARRLDVEGKDLENVTYLRVIEDAHPLATRMNNDEVKKAVVVGSGFIGMEVTSWLVGNGVTDITVVSRSEVPFQNVFGEQIGAFFKTLHEGKGVKFVTGDAASFEGKDGKVCTVVLSDGSRLDADTVIVGAGAILNTAFLKDSSSFELDNQGGVVVGSDMKGNNGVYAVGDIAVFPYTPAGGNVRIEHWDVAMNQARTAARNIAGKSSSFSTTPFFWTGQYGGVRYCGYTRGFDDVIFDGSIEEKKFVAYYVKEGVVTAAMSFSKDPYVVALASLMTAGKTPTPEDLRTGAVDVLKLAKEL